jgi:hypothetical protein
MAQRTQQLICLCRPAALPPITARRRLESFTSDPRGSAQVTYILFEYEYPTAHVDTAPMLWPYHGLLITSSFSGTRKLRFPPQIPPTLSDRGTELFGNPSGLADVSVTEVKGQSLIKATTTKTLDSPIPQN